MSRTVTRRKPEPAKPKVAAGLLSGGAECPSRRSTPRCALVGMADAASAGRSAHRDGVVGRANPTGWSPRPTRSSSSREAGGVRAILISEGDQAAPIARVTENAIAITGLAPRYLNNAVAALRLSSLPALVWWRGGAVDALDDLAELADRLVLEAEPGGGLGARADPLRTDRADRPALDPLTRWRALLAHLFDLPRGAGDLRLQRLSSKRATCNAARLLCRLAGDEPALAGRRTPSPCNRGRATASPIERVKLHGDRIRLTLAGSPSRACLKASVDGEEETARVVPAWRRRADGAHRRGARRPYPGSCVRTGARGRPRADGVNRAVRNPRSEAQGQTHEPKVRGHLEP